jgi:hypothetical protein
VSQIDHAYQHYHALAAEHGEEQAKKMLGNAARKSEALYDARETMGLDPDFVELLVLSCWPLVGLLLDLEQNGVGLEVGENGTWEIVERQMG